MILVLSGWLFWRKVGAGSWSSNLLAYDSESGDNKYWRGTIAADLYAGSDDIEYVLQIDYANDPGIDTTFLGTSDGVDNVKYASLAAAADHAFTFTYEAAPSNLGNCWHLPGNAEPEGTYMRNPRSPFADNDVYFYTGSVSPSVMAVVLGAVAIERHITLDRAMYGSDQAASLEPRGVHDLVEQIRKVRVVMGNGNKTITDTENEISKKLRYWL